MIFAACLSIALRRIGSSSFDPSLKQPKRSLLSTRSSGSDPAEMGKNKEEPVVEGNELGAHVRLILQGFGAFSHGLEGLVCLQ